MEKLILPPSEVLKLQDICHAAGGHIVFVSKRRFAEILQKRGVTRPPGIAGLAANYKYKTVFLSLACYRRSHLIADLAHEMWHILGSPLPPQKCDDENDVKSVAWKLALLRQIGCPLTQWQARWATSNNEGGMGSPWPDPPQGKLGDASPEVFLSWADRMIEAGKTAGYSIAGDSAISLGCVREDGRPVMLRSGKMQARRLGG